MPESRGPFGWDVAQRAVLAGVAAALGVALMLGAPATQGDPAEGPAALAVDPNTAPPGVLAALPRLGPTLVGRIVEARGESPFADAADLDARVRGVGPATIEALRPHLRFESKPGATSRP